MDLQLLGFNSYILLHTSHVRTIIRNGLSGQFMCKQLWKPIHIVGSNNQLRMCKYETRPTHQRRFLGRYVYRAVSSKVTQFKATRENIVQRCLCKALE